MVTETAYVTGEKTLKSTVDTAVREALQGFDPAENNLATIDVWAGDPLKEGSQKYLFTYESYGPPEKGTLITDLDQHLGTYFLKVKQVLTRSTDPNAFYIYVKAAN